MNNNNSSYLLATNYESFMVRALGLKYEFCASEMSNLIDIENGIKQYLIPSKEKQLQAIKKKLQKAFDAYLKLKLSDSTKKEIKECAITCQHSYNSASLLKEINRVLSITPVN